MLPVSKFPYTAAQITHFWKYVNRSDECWLWTGEKQVHGYGEWQVSKIGGVRVRVLAHRASWEITRGPIPHDKIVRHRCHIRACVNPDHLCLGTRGDNSRDMVRANRSTLGERNANARLTWVEVRKIREIASMGIVTNKAIALSLGMHPNYVGDIISGKAWPDREEVPT